MNNFITEIINKIESFFWEPEYISINQKGWFIFILIIVFVNALIIISFRDLEIYSNGSFKFGWLYYFELIAIYSFRDYFIFCFLSMAYKVPRNVIQDKIEDSLRDNDFWDTASNFDYSKHLRYNKKFRFKHYIEYFFLIGIVSLFIGIMVTPGKTECNDYAWFDRSGFEIDEPEKDFGEELNEDNYDRFYETYSMQCTSWDVQQDRFGREIVYTKDNTNPSDYILKVFLWLLTFSFLGVRQGIWRKTKWELNAENREKE